MTVTKIHIASRSAGGNKRPSGGDVWFDDGQSYGWAVNRQTDEIFFSSTRKVGGEHQFFTFKSPKRAAAIETYLNS